MSEELLLVDRRDAVAIVRLNRPSKLNALDDPLMGTLRDIIAALAVDETVGCVVLTGVGRGFCAGGDITIAPPRELLTREQREAKLRDFSRSAEMLREMAKPTIAMINGPCAGAGVGLAGACDLRFAGESAVIKSAFVDVGFSGDFGATWFWTDILGSARAREFMLLSDKMSARESLEFGLVCRVFPDDELEARTIEIAARFTGKRAWGYRLAKDNLNAAAAGSLLAEHLDLEARNMVAAEREMVRARKARAPTDAS